MNKILLRALAAAGGAAAMVAAFGTGTAAAVNEYKGQTYGDAVSAIQQAGGTAVIATKTGSYLQLGQCMVTGSRTLNFLNSSGSNSGGKTMLDLDCNYYFALPGIPGPSHGSPEGKQAYDQAVQQAQEQQQQQQEAAAAADGGGATSGG